MCCPILQRKENSAYVESLSASVKARYACKIKKFNGADPYDIKDEEMSRDWDNIDFNLEDHDIGHFLIHGLSHFTYEEFKNFKSERTSGNQAVNGYVREVPQFLERNGIVLVRGMVS
jgi:hypothetical protein